MADMEESSCAKTVLLGVTGGIAAYKSCEIVRGLQKAGCRVKVVMTEHATHFVAPLTFRTLTGEPVAVGLFDDPSDPIHHISLAKEADIFLIAPCTANVIAKIAYGIADDILTTTALARTCPLAVAPAMNVNMYENAATQANLEILKARGVHILDSDTGRLACGDEGKGKLAPVEDIVTETLSILGGDGGILPEAGERESGSRADLAGKKVLVTAGPTIEPIDPVRYITNHSSGKMGYAVAHAAQKRGADVTLVSGPVSIDAPTGVRLVSVNTADEMLEAVQDSFKDSDISVFSAAVSDMKPEHAYTHKLKKGADALAMGNISLVENPDIIKTVSSGKRPEQVVVGFAAETDDAIENAKIKLDSKKADIIVANEVGAGKVFGQDVSKVSFVTDSTVKELPEMAKTEIADLLLDEALKYLE